MGGGWGSDVGYGVSGVVLFLLYGYTKGSFYNNPLSCTYMICILLHTCVNWWDILKVHKLSPQRYCEILGGMECFRKLTSCRQAKHGEKIGKRAITLKKKKWLQWLRLNWLAGSTVTLFMKHALSSGFWWTPTDLKHSAGKITHLPFVWPCDYDSDIFTTNLKLSLLYLSF